MISATQQTRPNKQDLESRKNHPGNFSNRVSNVSCSSGISLRQATTKLIKTAAVTQGIQTQYKPRKFVGCRCRSQMRFL